MMKLAFGSFIVGCLLTGYGFAGDYIKQKVGIATIEQAKMTEDREQNDRLDHIEKTGILSTQNQKVISDDVAITNGNVNKLSVELREFKDSTNRRFDTMEGLLRVLVNRK